MKNSIRSTAILAVSLLSYSGAPLMAAVNNNSDGKIPIVPNVVNNPPPAITSTAGSSETGLPVTTTLPNGNIVTTTTTVNGNVTTITAVVTNIYGALVSTTITTKTKLSNGSTRTTVVEKDKDGKVTSTTSN